MDESRPLFVQIAEAVENDIIGGALPEGAQIPSINEFAAYHRINPATALKGVTRLVDDGLVEKRRGIGMFVVRGARQQLLGRRRARFSAQFVAPLLAEAAKLGITPEDLVSMIHSMAIDSMAIDSMPIDSMPIDSMARPAPTEAARQPTEALT